MIAKRIFDVVLALLGLILLSPLVFIAGVAVLITMGRPVLYSPTRAGRNGKPFKVRKFRSMLEDPTMAKSHHSGNDDPRITGVGRALRRFKLDELPQLWNVLRGEMSLVGPRPETLEYKKLYTPEQMEILSVRPGITDYASIEFADLGSLLAGDDPDALYFEKVWDRKMELRMKYVRERGFGSDLRLILLTLKAAILPDRKSES